MMNCSISFIYAVLFLNILLINLASGEWVGRSFSPSDGTCNSGTWANSSTVVITCTPSSRGSVGSILISYNGGLNWNLLSTSQNPADGALKGITSKVITGSLIFLAVGSNNVGNQANLYLSTNLALTWSLSATSTLSKSFYGVSLGSNGNAFMIGDRFTIFKATSVTSYQSITSSFIPDASTLQITTSNLKIFHFLSVCTYDGNNIIAAGNIGLIYYSSNSGSTWTKGTDLSSGTADYNSISCVSSSKAYLSGSSSYVAVTNNGGGTWTSLNGFPDYAANSVSSYGISVISLNTIFVSGILADFTNSVIYSSYDGGTTWHLEEESSSAIYSLTMYSSTIGIAGLVGNAEHQVLTLVPGLSRF